MAHRRQYGKSMAICTSDTDLKLPKDVAQSLGLSAGARLHLSVENGRVSVLPNIHSLSRVYLEPTSGCNLVCRTCIRNTWNEPDGDMEVAVFDRLVRQLREFDQLESVMLGGFGEPLSHDEIQYMVRRLKSLSLRVEITTNGTLLTEEVLAGLAGSGLDVLWVSMDGTRPDTHDPVRGASFERLLASLKSLAARNVDAKHRVALGIAFVVTRDNLNNLPDLTHLAQSVGAQMVSVSNVLPYSRDMMDQMVCRMALTESGFERIPSSIPISLPRLDITGATKDSLYGLLRSNKNISVLGRQVSQTARTCRFIRERCTFVRWDGVVSPCMGLIHSHEAYRTPAQPPRRVTGYELGSITSRTLKEIWGSEEYRAFRERVDAFDFSPCAVCGGCDYSETNEQDCFGTEFPTCGGCLWAQGVIQCP